MRAQTQKLHDHGRRRLARILDASWDEPLVDYSARLNEHSPQVELEPALERAFVRVFVELGWKSEEVETAVADLRGRRVLQTATHLTASEGPTFLAVHLMATEGLAPELPYLVGAFAGVPFSNPAWSGCLNYSDRYALSDLIEADTDAYRRLAKDQANRALDAVSSERRISLVPARMRDGLVHGSQVPDRLRELIAALCEPLRTLTPDPGEGFCNWASGLCQATARRVLNRKRVHYFDLNRVIGLYLAEVLEDDTHALRRLFFDERLRAGLIELFGAETILFYRGYEKKKRQRVDGLRICGEQLQGAAWALDFTPETLVAGLRADLLCPGVLLTFATLTFLNGFRCLGSFEQVEYLDFFERGLESLGWPAERSMGVDTGALTSGRCVHEDGRPIYPFDLVLGTDWEPPVASRVGDWIDPLMPRLMGPPSGIRT
jgi:hypothetical protein